MNSILLIEEHCKNFICGGTTMGPIAHTMLFAHLLEGDPDPRDPRLYNEGFPFRIWRDCGLDLALGRQRTSFSLDGQARTAKEAVELAGNDGVVTTTD